VHVSFLAASGRFFDESDFDIREQGDNDILLDLGSQVFVAAEVHCEEKDVACGLFVSVLRSAIPSC
jgi:hypothetical protein